MLQGTEKKILFLKSTKSKHFNEAYFILKDDVINDKSIDAIDICTPNIYHYETAKKEVLFPFGHGLS